MQNLFTQHLSNFLQMDDLYADILFSYIKNHFVSKLLFIYICQKMKEKNIEKEDLDYSTHSSLSDLVDDIILFLFLMGKKN